jgi:RNA-binding protein
MALSNALPYSKTKGKVFMPLTSGQRKFLRSQAHHLEPVVIIGKQGVTDTLLKAVSDALAAHELIKIRFNEFKDEKTALTERIATETGSEIAGTIGHVLILYREHPDEEKRKIVLPD